MRDENLVARIKEAFKKSPDGPKTSLDFYLVSKIIGKGAFGKVNLAKHRLSGQYVALKSLKKESLS